MSLVGLREVLRDSIKGKYAVGAFDATDHLFAESILLAAEETRTPVILMVGGFSRTCGLRQFLSVLGGSNQPDAGSGMPSF